MDQVKYWCGTMKANEEIIEHKSTSQNVLKRDYVMLDDEEEDEDSPVVKKKYFHPESEDEDWDDPSLHKLNTPNNDHSETNSNAGKILPRGKFNVYYIYYIM